MLRSGFRTRVATPRGSTRRAAARALPAALAVAVALAAAAPAQPPPGFASAVAFANTTHVAGLHRIAALGDGRHLVAHRGELYATAAAFGPGEPECRRLLLLAHEPIAFVDVDPTAALVGGLASGRVVRVDLANAAASPYAFGVANTFDVVRLASGDLLCAANPHWPAPGAHAGVWLVGPGRAPRELLALLGPSGPLALDANGDLIAAEIAGAGPASARLLRIPAARLQLALGGATLSMADVSAIGTGYAGIHDLVCTADGRVLTSDSGSSVVLATAAGSLAAGAVWFDAGAGRYATTLQLTGATGAPLLGWLPPAHAPAVAVVCSDFVSAVELVMLAPRRPHASVTPSRQLAAGTSTLHVAHGPAAGVALWLASAPSTSPELPVLALAGTPLWLSLDLPSTVPVALVALDASGAAGVPLDNPGGLAAAFDFQAVVLGPTPGQLGSSQRLALHFLP